MWGIVRLAVVCALISSAARAEILRWAWGQGWEADTYRWHFANAQQTLTTYSNRQPVRVITGTATSRILAAQQLQAHASNVTVALLDDGIHQQQARATIQSICGAVRFLAMPLSGGADAWSAVISNALAAGAQVLYMPIGSPAPNEQLLRVMSSAPPGVVFICAAPDEPLDYDATLCRTNAYWSNGVYVTNIFCDAQRDWPAAWNLPNVVAVTGHDIAGQPIFAKSTNYFDICAPARLIQSTATEFWSGNSAAAAIVAGVAALIRQRYPYDDVKARLCIGADVQPQYAGHCRTSGSLNAVRSLSTYTRLHVQRSGDLMSWRTLASINVLVSTSNEFLRVQMAP